MSAEDPGQQPPPRGRVPVAGGALVSLVLAATIGLAEITRLTGELVDAQGRAVSLADLVGVSRAFALLSGSLEAGADWARLDQAASLAGVSVAGWLVVYAVLDALAAAGLAVLLQRVIATGPRTWLRFTPYAFAAVRLLADVLLAVLAGARSRPPATLVGALAGAAWLLLALVLVVVVRRLLWAPDGRRSPWRRTLGGLVRALYAHRFSLVVVLLVGALVSLPGGEVFDQFPDAVRAWVDGARGAAHLAVAVAALG